MRPARRFHELSNALKAAFDGSNVVRRVQDFEGWTGRVSHRDSEAVYDHTRTVKEYYDLCSGFMVFGWGESLHFAPLSPGETLEDSIIRHQQLMISKLELRPGMTVVDIGCGNGGPMRRVAREAGVRVVGVNISEVQCNNAKRLNASAGLDDMTDCLLCSFMEMSTIADKTFDRGYAIESTCHAADKVAAFAEIYRVLKPGALFWGQEMCMTDLFDPGDDRHRAIKRELMHGIALKEIATFREVNRALETAGFEVMERFDLARDRHGPITPWYQPMETRGGPFGSAFRRTPMGRKALKWGSRMFEYLGVFPKGSTEVVSLLDRTASAYVAGGRAGIFTPLYCFVARRPLRG
ncbi:MAG: methyltransferase domain-containing protein [Acidobacteria bacterium]|nr:methyltransferase domain-containing protein [Acidobacteriota bacterium]